jgi:probable phosphomutase (TIGR03848 family)
VTTAILIRHGLTDATGSLLSGWTPGVRLNERGRAQAAALGEQLKGVPLAAIVSSPLERCVETAGALLDGRGAGKGAGGAPLAIQLDERLGEVRYGDWTGRSLRDVAREPLWEVVQARPSDAAFPGGESLREMQARAVAAIRDWNARLGRDAVYVACSHGDPIRAIVADALDMPLDGFGRLAAGPASVTIVRYADGAPIVLRLNGSGADSADLIGRPERPPTGSGRPPGDPEDAPPP